jgi:hypothetical protein
MTSEEGRTNNITTTSTIWKTSEQVELERAREVKRQEDEEFGKYFKICISAMKKMVGEEWFPVKPFLSPDQDRAEEEFGGDWQRRVCQELVIGRIPKMRMQEFWDMKKTGGKDCARDSLTRKRMNVTNTMKKTFQGRIKGGGGPNHAAAVSFFCRTDHFLLFLCLLVLLVEILAVWKEKGSKELPTPKFILGEVDGKRDHIDLLSDNERVGVLRELEEYRTLLFHFTGCLVGVKYFGEVGHLQLLSEYMPPCLEAFFVITYANNHDTWKQEECRGNSTLGSDEETVGTGESDDQQGCTAKRFTNQTKTNGGRFKGWSKEGFELFNKITRVLRIQRIDKVEAPCQSFEENLLRDWNNLKHMGNSYNRQATVSLGKRTFILENDFEWKAKKERKAAGINDGNDGQETPPLSIVVPGMVVGQTEAM